MTHARTEFRPEVSGTDWKLSVADNGMGKPDGVFAQPKTGLGTGIVNALAKQLNAQVETLSGSNCTMHRLKEARLYMAANRPNAPSRPMFAVSIAEPLSKTVSNERTEPCGK